MSHLPRPHILFITTDQQRGDCLSCDGHPVLETPYLDELASRGCRFTHAYSAVPSCVPARTAMLTGMDQWNHGLLSMPKVEYREFPATLPGELTRAGYQTRAVGKMHFKPQRAHYGFEHMILDESSRRDPGFISDYHQWFDGAKQGPYGYRDHSVGWNSWMARPTHLPEHLHPTHWTAAEAIRFLHHRDPVRPFFMWLSFARPHSPYDAPKVYFDRYDGHPDIPLPVVGDWAARFDQPTADTDAQWGRRPERDVRRARAGYYGNINFIDDQIGLVLYELRKLGPEIAQNTLVVFTSDHGDMIGDHHRWRKSCAYEGAARIPFLIAYPESWDLPRGEVYEQPIELRDVMPTLLDAAGVEIPESVDGRSLLDIARGEAADWREFIQGEHVRNDDMAMQYVTDGKEKFVWLFRTGKEQFFDLVQDPLECRNLAGQPGEAKRIDRWRRRLAEINERRGDPRGKNGQLIPHDEVDAFSRSPNCDRWEERGREALRRNFGHPMS